MTVGLNNQTLVQMLIRHRPRGEVKLVEWDHGVLALTVDDEVVFRYRVRG